MKWESLLKKLRFSPIPYLNALVLTIIFSRYAQYLWQYVWPGIPVLYGQAPGIYVQGFGFVVTTVLWLLYRGNRTRQPLLIAFLSTLLVSWLVLLAAAQVHQDGFAYDVYLYPLVIIGLLFKTPPAADCLAAIKTAGWTVALVLVSTRATEMAGWIPMVNVGEALQSFERSEYWLPLAGTLGPEGRWPGPFGHNAMTGNAATMLVVLAVALRGPSRWALGLVGILTLLLTSSRTSFLATACGVAVVIASGDNALTRRLTRRNVVLGGAALVAAASTLVIASNTELTGRVQFWTTSIEVWRQSPLIGVGATGMAKSPAAFAGTNAHNLVVDALLKSGIAGASLVVAVLGLAFVLAWKASRAGATLPLGIVVAYFVIGLAQSDQGWMAMSMPWMWLVLASILAGSAIKTPQERELSKSSGAWTG